MSRNYVYSRADDLGIPVIDAKERVFLGVTQSDIVNAKKANSKHCALARAAMRLPEVQAAYFFRTTAFIEYSKRILRFDLPEVVQKEIVSFDRAQIMDPGVYQLSPPSPSRSAASLAKYHAEVANGTRKRATRKRVPKKSEIKSYDDAIAKIEQLEPKNDTPEQRDFDRRMRRMSAGVVGPKAPAPVLPHGNFVRRNQYVRDLKEPK